MRVQRTDDAVIVQTPAKLNLFLEVLSKRNDGYHELATLMVAITIHDTLVLSPEPNGGIYLQCGWSSGREAQRRARLCAGSLVDEDSDAAERSEGRLIWETLPSGSANLVHRAVECLRDRANLEMGARILLHKRIPSAAGLGGASSDAAAALVAAAHAFDLPADGPLVQELATELGSDVPFFHEARRGRGAAVCTGRGEKVEWLPTTPAFHFVIVRPPAGLATAEVYRHCRPADAPRDVDEARAAFASGDPTRLSRALGNGLQEPAERLSPWVRHLRRVFSNLDVLGHQLSGSGTSYFGICRNARHAGRVAARVRAMIGGAVFHATTES